MLEVLHKTVPYIQQLDLFDDNDVVAHIEPVDRCVKKKMCLPKIWNDDQQRTLFVQVSGLNGELVWLFDIS